MIEIVCWTSPTLQFELEGADLRNCSTTVTLELRAVGTTSTVASVTVAADSVSYADGTSIVTASFTQAQTGAFDSPLDRAHGLCMVNWVGGDGRGATYQAPVDFIRNLVPEVVSNG